jgi:hypothetical protein
LEHLLKSSYGVSIKTGSSVVKPVINGLFGSRGWLSTTTCFRRPEWGTIRANLDNAKKNHGY